MNIGDAMKLQAAQMTPGNLAKQAAYENARMAILNAYSFAANLQQGRGQSPESYVMYARKIARELMSDLDRTMAILEDKKQPIKEEANGNQELPAAIPTPA